MNRQRLQTGLLLAVLAGFLFQWEARQIVAWGGMILEYSREGGLNGAVQDTFSGEKPCSKCLSLTREQTPGGEEETFTAQNLNPPELEPPLTAMSPSPDGKGLRTYTPESWSGNTGSLPPPTPPPKFFQS